jgi:acetoin utilization deacetylase AcuC-like enzyme
VNYPLDDNIRGETYRTVLAKALDRIRRFNPRFLVVALGLDTAKGDPTGSWLLTGRDFEKNGAMIGGVGLPTLFVQEGGYRTRSLGSNATAFFQGVWRSVFGR